MIELIKTYLFDKRLWVLFGALAIYYLIFFAFMFKYRDKLNKQSNKQNENTRR